MRGFHNSSFDPQTLVVLEAAFDEAWLTLKAIGNTTVKPDELARSVLRLAMDGERDPVALHEKLWCAPGDCYSYATSSPHLASIVLRQLTGMELEQYIRLKIADPLGFGTWGYAMYRPGLKAGINGEGRLDHTPGGGSIAVRSTDVLRFVIEAACTKLF